MRFLPLIFFYYVTSLQRLIQLLNFNHFPHRTETTNSHLQANIFLGDMIHPIYQPVLRYLLIGADMISVQSINRYLLTYSLVQLREITFSFQISPTPADMGTSDMYVHGNTRQSTFQQNLYSLNTNISCTQECGLVVNKWRTGSPETRTTVISSNLT